MPSAVALSILIHAALFLLAGMLAVFTVVKKEEKKFVPPKVLTPNFGGLHLVFENVSLPPSIGGEPDILRNM